MSDMALLQPSLSHKDMNSATPSRPSSGSVATNLQSTPQSLGSAARSKDLLSTGLHVDDVHPWIQRDIEDAQECALDTMLKFFLSRCATEESKAKEVDLFSSCYNRVLLICNGEIVNNIDSSKIKCDLTDYSTGKREQDLYPAFVGAANTALACLRDLKIDGLCDPSNEFSDQLVFHVNGREMQAVHLGEFSIRKPDIVLVSSADVPRKSDETSDIATIARKPPTENFNWRSVRTVVEFKLAKIKPPPPHYLTNDTDHLVKSSRKYLVSHHNEPTTTHIATTSQHESDCSTSHRVREPGSVTAGSTESRRRQKRKATTTEVESLEPEASAVRLGLKSQISKRQKANEDGPKKPSPVTQLGMYAAEMFASHAGRTHVIALIIRGDHLYIWYYDRQHAIQCAALNFIQDLPRFLILLLAMQRFRNRDWGLNPIVDPNFANLPKPSSPNSPVTTTFYVDHTEKGKVDITLDWSSDIRVTHYGLNGRATNLFSITSEKLGRKEELVAKFFWAEVTRTSEPEILQRVYEIAKSHPEVKDHVPDLILFVDFPESCTDEIRKYLALPTDGARKLYMIVFRRLFRITELDGDPLLTCWWHAVKCHLALWKNGVRHRDVSANNLMVKYRDNKAIGVLNDYDLATTKDHVTGNQRTGTVPFMALNLLTKDGLAGEVKHLYAHDAESFMWVLLWISLRYEKGKLRSDSHRPLDQWLKVDAVGCGEKKSGLLTTTLHKQTAASGQERNFTVACKCLLEVKKRMYEEMENAFEFKEPEESASEDEDVDKAFQRLLQVPLFSLAGEAGVTNIFSA
ncbi:hypothetical protein JVU11DRAFT_9234 [Chiua virens]|nr:hypothetical protein JVU11DRAFT_9234 [Chiua virens]